MARLDSLIVPEWMLNRNNPKVKEVGLENTGQASLEFAKERLGIANFEDTDILDVGCGVRFTATFVNHRIPVKSYTGIELVPKLVEFLQSEVEAKDDHFKFEYWDVHNARYNKMGKPMSEFDRFPVDGDFDIIWMWSVFTHLAPSDSADMLRLSRNHIRPDGKLFFSAFIDDDIDEFDDRDPVNTLTYAYYSRRYLESLVEAAGWSVESFAPPNPRGWVQSTFVCRPA